MNGILKDELGFQGFVMSDWLAQISGVPSALAGLDMSMPGDINTIPLLGDSFWMYEETRSILNGSLPVDRLNDQVTRILAAWYQMGQDQNFPATNFDTYTTDATGELYPGALVSPTGVVNDFVDVQGNHSQVAKEIARDAITLLKNVNSTLPLKANATTLKIFGTDAEKNPNGINSCSDQGCNTGTLGMGWGSGSAKYPYLDSPIDAIKNRSVSYQFFNTDTFPSNSNPLPNDTALVFVTADSGENYITVEGNPGDRTEAGLSLWHNGDTLIENVAAKYNNVIVIVHTVGPVLLENWIDLPSVKAVLFAHLPGQEAGDSLAQVLFGDVSPSGHLPYSVPKAESDYPASVSLVGFELGQPQDTFSEGLYIDYRYFNKQKITPRYAFGYGLSYTTFLFSNASITTVTALTATPPARPAKGSTPSYSDEIPPASEAYWPSSFDRIWRYLYSWLEQSDADAAAKIANSSTKYPYPAGYSNTQTAGPPAGGGQGGNPALFDVAYNVTVTVTNTGNASGKAVAQLYVQFPNEISYDTPIIQLRDFDKTDTLAAGASQQLTMRVTRKDLSVWDVVDQNWIVPNPSGDYGIWLGESSDALTLRCSSSTGTCQEGVKSPV